VYYTVYAVILELQLENKKSKLTKKSSYVNNHASVNIESTNTKNEKLCFQRL